MRSPSWFLLVALAACSTPESSQAIDRAHLVGDADSVHSSRGQQLLHGSWRFDLSDEEAARQVLPDVTFTLDHVRQGLVGTYFRFGQTVDGLPVLDGEIVVHVLPDGVGAEVRDILFADHKLSGWTPPAPEVAATSAVAVASAMVGHAGPVR
jgi:Zn-dependent metalloprotease